MVDPFSWLVCGWSLNSYKGLMKDEGSRHPGVENYHWVFLHLIIPKATCYCHEAYLPARGCPADSAKSRALFLMLSSCATPPWW